VRWVYPLVASSRGFVARRAPRDGRVEPVAQEHAGGCAGAVPIVERRSMKPFSRLARVKPPPKGQPCLSVRPL
jgi:hypothetical protein